MDCGKAFQVTYIGRATKFFVCIDPFTGLADEVVGKSTGPLELTFDNRETIRLDRR